MNRGADVAILNGQSVSAVVDLGGRPLVGILIPAVWTAANITLQAAVLGGQTPKNVHKSDGTEYTITTGGQDRLIMFIASEILFGLQNVIFRSGTSGAAVPQGADRILIPILG